MTLLHGRMALEDDCSPQNLEDSMLVPALMSLASQVDGISWTVPADKGLLLLTT